MTKRPGHRGLWDTENMSVLGKFCDPLYTIRLAVCVPECICTMLFVLCGCASTLLWDRETPPSVEYISLSFGLTCAVLVDMASPLSGGQINPAVTVAMAVRGKISIIRAVSYVISQITGALMGSAILYCIAPADTRGLLGTPQLNSLVSVPAGFGVEVLMTFLLVYMVLVCTSQELQITNHEAALLIGMTVTVCHMFALQITGCGINPARAIGPAAVMSKWDHHWIYWAGPITGALIAAGTHYITETFLTPSTHVSLEVRGKELQGSNITGTLLSENPLNPMMQQEIQTYL